MKTQPVGDTTKGLSVLVYGESGSGKTTLIGTLKGKTLLLDAEGGTSVLRGKTGIDVVKIHESMEDFKETMDEVVTIQGYENVCMDSATEVEKFMQVVFAGRSKEEMPSLHDYGVISFKMRDYLRRLRDLRERGINVVVTALEMPLELQASDGEIHTRSYPMLAKKMAPEVCGLFDVVAHLEISSKKDHEGERWLRMDGTPTIIAKNRATDDKHFTADLGAFIKKYNGKETK